MKSKMVAIAVTAALLGACSTTTPARNEPAIERDDDWDRGLLDLVWASMTTAERDQFCRGYIVLGPNEAFGYFADGAGDSTPTFSVFKTYFDGRCT